MEKAHALLDILRVTDPKPLRGEDFEKFFVLTDEARGENAAKRLATYLKVNREIPRKILFMGHRGSGKSTELYRLEQYLNDDFWVVNFSIREEADLINLEYSDLLFVILDKLFDRAVKDKMDINPAVLANLQDYWTRETTKEVQDVLRLSSEAGTEASIGFFNLVRARVKAVLSTGRESKTTVRQHIEPRVSQLITSTNDVIADIARQLRPEGKTPLLIIEDLDKLDRDVAEKLFLKNTHLLTQFDLHVIYTFPIFLHYSSHFDAIEQTFDYSQLLSMIKVRDKAGAPFVAGKDTLRRIIGQRADLALFEPEALEFMIDKSGGALRHLLEMIQNAVLNAAVEDEQAARIRLDAARKAYLTLRNSFERSIELKHLETLRELRDDPEGKPLSTAEFKDLLNFLAVIEYNGERWCGLHPAVADYLDIIDRKSAITP